METRLMGERHKISHLLNLSRSNKTISYMRKKRGSSLVILYSNCTLVLLSLSLKPLFKTTSDVTKEFKSVYHRYQTKDEGN